MSNEEPIKKVTISNTISVKLFSERLKLPVSTVITELLKNGIIASINEEIDFDTASVIATDLGYEAEEETESSEGESLTLEKLIEILKKEKEANINLKTRPPVVTILGHVDHGKTTLLDTIRKANVVEGEVGGITQHISAYQAKKKGQLITFIDTPGHEAFSAMRERGVSIADVAVLVVAADDGVRPQTKEVVSYLKEKQIPTVVAINKIDRPEANPQRVKQELTELGLLLEGWGGNTAVVEVSAKNNIGIDDLLDSILLISEVEEFKADPKRDGLAVVLEANLDPQKGPIATVLVKTGTLKVGQDISTGSAWGRIRRIENYLGKTLQQADPSMPVTIIGLNQPPQSNEVLQVIDATSKQKRRGSLQAQRGKTVASQKKDDTKQLSIILKVDVQGTLEAIQQILDTIPSDEVSVSYISVGVGSITETDVKMAQSANALIFGFSVESTAVARRMAEQMGVKIKSYRIIYELIEDIKSGLAELLPPEIIRTDFGKLKVLAIFKNGKHDMIVGGRVIDGKIVNESEIEVMREDAIIGKGQLSNLQRNKVNTNEVTHGHECGVTFLGDTKIKEADVLASFRQEVRKRKL